MKIFLTCLALTLPLLAQEKAPEAFQGYLVPDVAVKGEIVVVVPPDEIEAYLEKAEEAAKKDPEWFQEYSKTSKPGIPLAYDEKLGLTKEEYREYLDLWDQREMKPVPRGELVLRLEKSDENEWMIRATGRGSDITTMRYNEESDTFTSTSGTLKRIADIDADARSILGAWKGHEWSMELKDSFGITKENLAIGKMSDGSHGLLVYRLQEVSSAGRPLFDKSMVIRFTVKQN
jgi:hypothetical protein